MSTSAFIGEITINAPRMRVWEVLSTPASAADLFQERRPLVMEKIKRLAEAV